MNVKAPFAKRYRPWMIEGVKTLDPRDSQLVNALGPARRGDHFRAFEATFFITDIFKLKLGEIIERYYLECGFISSAEFEQYQREVRHSGYFPNKRVFLYEFKIKNADLQTTYADLNECPFCPEDHRPDPNSNPPYCEHFIGYQGDIAHWQRGDRFIKTMFRTIRVYRITKKGALV